MRRSSTRLLLNYIVAAVLVAGIIAFGIRHFHHVDRSSAESPSGPGKEEIQPEKFGAALRAKTRQTKTGLMIRLEWDASAKPILGAPYGILYIYDGGAPSKVVLPRRTLNFGFTDYMPISDEVTFHLVLPGGGSEGESLLVLLGAHTREHAGLVHRTDASATSERQSDSRAR